MIASFFDGRVRLRGDALKDPEFLANVRALVGKQKGILELRDNPRVGSLLVLYDPAVVSREDLLAAAQVLETNTACQCEPKHEFGPRLLSRKQENTLLGAVYGLTALGGFAYKRLHVASGALLTLLVLKHLFDRRRCL